MTQTTIDDFYSQGNEIKTLRKQIENHTFVHALLITGEVGTGKRTLAGLLCEALMCKAQAGIPCGNCSGCRLTVSGEHPDVTVIEKGIPLARESAKGRASIPVDDIREMIRICSQYPLEGGNRVGDRRERTCPQEACPQQEKTSGWALTGKGRWKRTYRPWFPPSGEWNPSREW